MLYFCDFQFCYLVLEADSIDSLAKCDDDTYTLRSHNMSFLNDQLQKHLLSSTLQSNTSRARSGQSCSPTNISTTPALSFVPTPSPSPFNINDMSFTLATDPKSVEMSLGESTKESQSRSSYVDYLETSAARFQERSIQPQLKASARLPLLGQDTYSSQSAPGDQPPMAAISAGQQDVKLLLVEPPPMGLVQPSSGPRYSDTVLPSSSINQVTFPIRSSSNAISSNFIHHPNKKKRLLTFLSEQENSMCSVNDNSQIILTPAQKPDQIILNSGKPDQILINPGKAETLNSSQTPTLFLQPAPIESVKHEQPTLIINPPPPPKNESTLIINSEGTAATLFTPVSATASLPLLAPCIAPSLLGPLPLSRSASSASIALVQSAPNIDLLPVNFPAQSPAKQQDSSGHNIEVSLAKINFDQYTEAVTCYKCKLCGYLVLNQSALKHHFIDDHEDIIGLEDNIPDSTWLPSALKFGIQLNCPLCSNTFRSGRSFQVHVTEDHGVSEREAEVQLDARNRERKEKVLNRLREEKRQEREARKKKRRLSYETYIDNNNEMKVRLPRSSSSTFDIAKNNLSANSQSTEGKRRQMSSSSSGITTVLLPQLEAKNKVTIADAKLDNARENRKVLYKQYRRIAPATSRGDEVPLPENRGKSGNEKSHFCEADGCEFRTTSRAKLDRHGARHTGSICPSCGLAFKLAKQLRAHISNVHTKAQTSSSLVCQLCKASFNTPRQLRLHTDSVHNKKRNFLCSVCGYSGGSKSALKLHARKHTGEKPFMCDECDFSSSDHNSFRRHRMRHSGV